MKKFFKKEAFTIIEVMVSTGIIVLMSGFFLLNLRDSRGRSELNSASNKIITDFRLAQNNSLGGVSQNSGNVYWGLHFEKNKDFYFIFKDVNSNYNYDVGADEVFKREDFGAGITLKYNKNNASVDVIFEPPFAKVYINGSYFETLKLTLNLRSLSKDININYLGLIEAD